MTTTGTTLAKRLQDKPTPAKGQTLPALLEQMKPQIARALPNTISAERFTRIALTAVRQNPRLLECAPASVLGALMTSAQLGLEPNTPLGEAYLIPYKGECTFQPGYAGLVRLAWQSGMVQSISVELVHANDTFKRTLGLHPDIVHEIDDAADRGPVIGCYAVVRMTGGGFQAAYMSKDEIDAHAKKFSQSAGRSSSPWVTSWDAMAKKTVLKQALKLVPKATEMARALTNDGLVRTDIDPAFIDTVEIVADDDDPVVDETTGEITSG